MHVRDDGNFKTIRLENEWVGHIIFIGRYSSQNKFLVSRSVPESRQNSLLHFVFSALRANGKMSFSKASRAYWGENIFLRTFQRSQSFFGKLNTLSNICTSQAAPVVGFETTAKKRLKISRRVTREEQRENSSVWLYPAADIPKTHAASSEESISGEILEGLPSATQMRI